MNTFGSGVYPLPDTIHGLAILVDFDDKPALLSHSHVDSLLNSGIYDTQTNELSVSGYYSEVSHNSFTILNHATQYVRAEKPFSYYAALNDYSHSKSWLKELLSEVEAQGFDFNKLTFKNDTLVSLSIFYTGRSYGNKFLHPHQDDFPRGFEYNGLSVNSYMITSLTEEFEIGTAIHELNHLLFDWHDLYSDYTEYDLGVWGIMGHTDYLMPQSPNPYYLFTQNWVDTIDITGREDGTQLTCYPNDSVVFVYRKNKDYREDSNEAMFIQYLKNEGINAMLPGEGLAVWVANEKRSSNKTIEPDVFLRRKIFTDSSALLTTGDIMNDTTAPNTNWHYTSGFFKGSFSFLELYDIHHYEDSINFKIRFNAKALTADTVLTPGVNSAIECIDCKSHYHSDSTILKITVSEPTVVGRLQVGHVRVTPDFSPFGTEISDVPYISFKKLSNDSGWVHYRTKQKDILYIIPQQKGTYTISTEDIDSIYQKRFDELVFSMAYSGDTTEIDSIRFTHTPPEETTFLVLRDSLKQGDGSYFLDKNGGSLDEYTVGSDNLPSFTASSSSNLSSSSSNTSTASITFKTNTLRNVILINPGHEVPLEYQHTRYRLYNLFGQVLPHSALPSVNGVIMVVIESD
ncbi:MAG: hypothetical protein OCD01_19470 [Fibrobacterales bacterium]